MQTVLNQAVVLIVQTSARSKGVKSGEEASLAVAIGPLVAELLHTLINSCLSSLTPGEVAEQMVHPTEQQADQFRRLARQKAKRTITKKNNPSGGKLKGRDGKDQLRQYRLELEDDLYQSMRQSATEAGVEATTELVIETRAAA